MQREEIVAALTALGKRLSEREVEGEVYVVGGAAIAIAFDACRATRAHGAWRGGQAPA